jgi:5-hydroxyisourate hydrolase-like protein (transthyretin family)
MHAFARILRTVLLAAVAAGAGAGTAAAQGSLSGRVTDAGSVPLAGVSVQIYDSLGQGLTAAFTDPAGNFSISSLPAGTVFARTFNQLGYVDQLYAGLTCVGFCEPTLGTPITVTNGGATTGVNFALAQGGRIAGRVTEPGGSALANVNLAVVNAANFTFAFTTTDAAGNYVVLTGLPAGQYLVKTLNQAGYVDELYSDVPCVTSSCSTASATPVSVVVGSSTTVNFVLDPGGRIAGVVRDEAGVPLPGARVDIYNAAGTFVEGATTDGGGAYLNGRGLTGGTYFARTRQTGAYVSELYDNAVCAGQCQVNRGTPITVALGATTGGIDFALRVGGQIAGHIVDAGTLTPIVNASISVYAGNGSFVTFANTDFTGNYLTADGLPSGTYYVTADGPGYVGQVHDGHVCVGCAPTSGNGVTVTAGSTTGGIDFALGVGGRIAGNVTAAGGAALPGVSLEIRNAAGTFVTSASTDSGGRFLSGSGLQAGTYLVNVRNQLGYVDEVYNNLTCVRGCANATAGTGVAVSLGSTTTGVNFALASGGRVEGTVTDSATGLPLGDATVFILDASGFAVSSGRTDSRGRYRSGAGLVAGTYFARTSNQTGHLNELYANVPCSSGCPVDLGTAFTVALGGTTTGINFGLDLGGRVTGTVRDAGTGTALANVNVQIQNDFFFASAITDSLGRYTVLGLPAGTFYARTSNALGYLDELRPDILCASGCPITTGAPITVTPGVTVSGIDFDLNRGGRIAGHVTEASSGLPLAGVRVVLVDAAGRSGANGVTDLSGAFVTGAGVLGGTYYARTSNGLGFIEELYDDVECVGGCSLARGAPITVSVGATTSGIDFALGAGLRIEGTVTDQVTGAGLDSVDVGVFDASGRRVTGGFTDAAGHYTTASGVPAGTYYLTTQNFAGYIDALYNGRPCPGGSCAPVTGTPVVLAGAPLTSGIDFALARGGRIAGRIIDGSTLLPLVDAGVQVYDASGRRVATGFTDPQGRYLTDTGLPAGTYYARTSNVGGYVNRLYDGLPCPGTCTVTAGLPIVVAAGSTTNGVNFSLSAGGRITGTITDATTGSPLAGVTVSIFDGTGKLVSNGVTSSAGFYRTFEGLPTGTYFARTANSAGYVNGLYAGIGCSGACVPTAGTPISVTAGSTRAGVNFALNRGARISGHVVTRTGARPIPNVTVTLHDSAGTQVGSVVSDGQGDFITPEGVPAGTYYARTQNGQGYVDQVYAFQDCLAGCNPTTGTGLVLMPPSTRPNVNFELVLDDDLDGDGIAATIDRNQGAGTDESTFLSNDFNDTPLGGTTAGTITARGGWTLRVGDISPGGIRAAVLGTGASPAVLSICPTSGPEGVVLDVTGETAEAVCSAVGSATVKAIVATPAVQLRKPVSGPGSVVDLTTGQAATMGSPIVASLDNTVPILVRFVDAAGATFGSLELDPGESVETTVVGASTVQVAVWSASPRSVVRRRRCTPASRGRSSRAPRRDPGPIDALVAAHQIRMPPPPRSKLPPHGAGAPRTARRRGRRACAGTSRHGLFVRQRLMAAARDELRAVVWAVAAVP